MQPLHSYFRQLAICKPRLTSKFTTLDTLTYQFHLAVKTKNDPNTFKEHYEIRQISIFISEYIKKRTLESYICVYENLPNSRREKSA